MLKLLLHAEGAAARQGSDNAEANAAEAAAGRKGIVGGWYGPAGVET